MMNHPQKGIFTPNRNQPLSGRNANIQPTMFKRKQIFEKTTAQRHQTPFSGYSFTGSSVTDNNSLARSQVSQFSQISQENVLKMIKEQLQNNLNLARQKTQQSHKYKNELNILRIQIRGTKQNMLQMHKSMKKKLQQQNEIINDLKKQLGHQNQQILLRTEGMQNQFQQTVQRIQKSVAQRLKLLYGQIQKDRQSQKKALISYVNAEFVPKSFIDDLDKQFDELQDKIQNMENEIQSGSKNGNKQNLTASKIARQSSMSFSSGSQLKLKQFQRDIANLKKQLDENTAKLKFYQSQSSSKHENYLKQVGSIREALFQINGGLKQTQKQNKSIKENLQAKLQNDKKKIFEKLQIQLETLSRKIDHQIALKLLTISNSLEPQNEKRKSQSTSIIMQNSQNLSIMSNKFQDVKEQSKASTLTSSINRNSQVVQYNQPKQKLSNSPSKNKSQASGAQTLMNSKESPKKARKITITYGANDKGSQQVESQPPLISASPESFIKSNTNQSSLIANKEEQQIKTIYKVDKDGYLMDCHNKYLLSQSNAMIYVSQQQIEAMQKTNLIKIQRWSKQVAG